MVKSSGDFFFLLKHNFDILTNWITYYISLSN
jgi:hypothetical protein